MKEKIVKKLKSSKFYENYRIVRDYVRDFLDLKTERSHMENYSENYSGKIKVAFLAQYLPAWNKFETLYQELLNDKRFDVKLICIPLEIRENKMYKKNNENTIYNYYAEKGYDAINALNPNGSWLDLQPFSFDYIIYTRPYNSYMPPGYTSNNVSKYARIVNILYGMILSEEGYDIVIDYDFFKDVYIFFADSETTKKKFYRQYLFSVKNKLKRCYYLGLPGSEQILNSRSLKTEIWDFAENRFKVIWTPRWTDDPALGGSNFFVYYKSILKFANDNPDIAILIRPHPFLFDNFIKRGKISRWELTMYKAKISSMANVALDQSPEYDATIWGSDAMLSDWSGMMPEYFITGKPLIYCSSNSSLNMTEDMKMMMKGCYIASDRETAFEYIKMLKQGKDSKLKIRKQLADKIFKINSGSMSKKMADCLYRGVKENIN